MEALLFLGGIIVVMGGFWTIQDLLEDAGFLKKTVVKDKSTVKTHYCSDFKSRDISSNTACRAGL